MNDYDWVCADTEDGATEVYTKHLIDTLGEGIDTDETLKETEPRRLSEEELDTFKFYDDTADGSIGKHRSFREELELRDEPGFFASSEY
jgi:hypothetical protein